MCPDNPIDGADEGKQEVLLRAVLVVGGWARGRGGGGVVGAVINYLPFFFIFNDIISLFHIRLISFLLLLRLISFHYLFSILIYRLQVFLLFSLFSLLLLHPFLPFLPFLHFLLCLLLSLFSTFILLPIKHFSITFY